MIENSTLIAVRADVRAGGLDGVDDEGHVVVLERPAPGAVERDDDRVRPPRGDARRDRAAEQADRPAGRLRPPERHRERQRAGRVHPVVDQDAIRGRAIRRLRPGGGQERLAEVVDRRDELQRPGPAERQPRLGGGLEPEVELLVDKPAVGRGTHDAGRRRRAAAGHHHTRDPAGGGRGAADEREVALVVQAHQVDAERAVVRHQAGRARGRRGQEERAVAGVGRGEGRQGVAEVGGVGDPVDRRPERHRAIGAERHPPRDRGVWPEGDGQVAPAGDRGDDLAERAVLEVEDDRRRLEQERPLDLRHQRVDPRPDLQVAVLATGHQRRQGEAADLLQLRRRGLALGVARRPEPGDQILRRRRRPRRLRRHHGKPEDDHRRSQQHRRPPDRRARTRPTRTRAVGRRWFHYSPVIRRVSGVSPREDGKVRRAGLALDPGHRSTSGDPGRTSGALERATPTGVRRSGGRLGFGIADLRTAIAGPGPPRHAAIAGSGPAAGTTDGPGSTRGRRRRPNPRMT